MPDVLVVGVAILHHGRVLAARRTDPPEARGGWEFPGGKVEPGEAPRDAAVREVREELGCEVTVTGELDGVQPVKPGYALQVLTAELLSGEPIPREHDAVRWLGLEDLASVHWLEPDLPFLPELRRILLAGERLGGGNVGGAVRIGRTVRRPTGPWSPAVHRLLAHLNRRGLRAVPELLGTDELGREVLTHLPGDVVDVDTEMLTDCQLVGLASWTRDLHAALDGYHDAGPWRFPAADGADRVCHNDIAPYNACFHGDTLVGVFDWDVAGPSTTLLELALLAWNGVPLFRDIGAERAAGRLRLLADSYGGPTAGEVLAAVPVRVRSMIEGIPAAAAAGDQGMRNLMTLGEPDRTERSLEDLLARMPALKQALG